MVVLFRVQVRIITPDDTKGRAGRQSTQKRCLSPQPKLLSALLISEVASNQWQMDGLGCQVKACPGLFVGQSG